MTVVAVLGAGVMGCALTVPLVDGGHEVHLVGTHLDRKVISSIQDSGHHPRLRRTLPRAVRAFQLEDAERAFSGAEVVLSSVNSAGVHWCGQRLSQLLRPGQLVIADTKGMEATTNGDLRILPDVLAGEVDPDLRAQVTWSAIAGPSIAGEVAARRHTCVVFTGRDQPSLDRLADTFRTPAYHVWTSTDLVGVQVCGAMKNCYAFAVGIAEGQLQRLGEPKGGTGNFNAAAAIFGQASVEMMRMVQVLGGRPETAAWLPGVADCYVTSIAGRSVRAGRLVGTGMRFSEARSTMQGVTLEGVAAIEVIGGALPKLVERGLIGAAEFPLLRWLSDIVTADAPADVPWDRFFG